MSISNKIKVIIVDDSALIRQLFTEILESDREIQVVGTASNPIEARDKIKQLNPDVITLDIEMPKMDGISFLQKIMTLRPMPVVMVSTLTQKGADETIKALELGAFDFVSKPTGAQTSKNLSLLKEELIEKVKNAAKGKIKNISRSAESNERKIIKYNPSNAKDRIIAIGSSTGGVEAIRDILVKIPENSPPIIITQHMPEKFTASFAARLNSLCEIEVHEAENNQKILPGNAYIAPGGIHLELGSSSNHWVCKLHNEPPISGHRPSVDVLFSSVAKNAGDKAIGVILTGMGKDGAMGILKMKKAGAYTIAQNEESCVVYGMPKAAVMNRAIDIELHLDDIAHEILKKCN